MLFCDCARVSVSFTVITAFCLFKKVNQLSGGLNKGGVGINILWAMQNDSRPDVSLFRYFGLRRTTDRSIANFIQRTETYNTGIPRM